MPFSILSHIIRIAFTLIPFSSSILPTDDKVVEIEGMLKTLKAQEYKLLTNFMYLSISDLDLYVDITEDGQYVLTVKAISDRLIDIGKFL